jgi:hypothetical protein
MLKRDVAATEARHFTNKKSYVAKDGREVLLGRDWMWRKGELWERAGGRCEYATNFSLSHSRCPREGQIPAHIEPRHPKRDDRMSNLKLYCIEHDRLTEKQSWRRIRSDRKEHRSLRAQEA